MNETIIARDAVLESLVSLRKRYCDLATAQSERLDAIRTDSVPPTGYVAAERSAFAEEGSIVEQFLTAAGHFPVFKAEPGFVVTKVEEKSRWFGIRKTHEVLKEAEPPELPEARLQDARLLHLLGMLGEDLSSRRIALQHASYTLKRAVVGLNQAAQYSEGEGARVIERDRHGLETLVSLVDKALVDLVVALRRGETLSGEVVPVEPAAERHHLPADGYAPLMLAG